MKSRAVHLLQHLKVVKIGERGGRKEVVRVGGSRTVAKVVEEGVVRQKLKLQLRKFQRVRTRIVQGKEVLG